MPARERLFLLDGMALAYRAYYALISRPLVNSRGENTSAIYGFVNALMKIVNEERPEYIAVVFDTPEPTFRHKKFKEYKATREKMPEEMAGQLDRLKEVVRAFRTPLIEVPGYEADDVIGTLARRAEREQVHTFMVTGDKDFMQLVSPLISIYKPGKAGGDSEVINSEGVRTKFGVLPEQVIDVLGLMGDSSDNVPGVPGIGPKTAIPLIQKFGSLPELYDRASDIPQKRTREKLLENRDMAFLSREIVTIQTDVPLDLDFHTLRFREPDTTELVRLFRELDFRTLIDRIRKQSKNQRETEEVSPSEKATTDIRQTDHEYRCITTTQDLRGLVRALSRIPRFVVDTETTSMDLFTARLAGLSFCIEPGAAYFVPMIPQSEHEKSKPGDGWSSIGFSDKEAIELLQPVLENRNSGKMGHDIKFDILVLMKQGICLRDVVFDTMIASYVLRPNGQHSLDSLATEYFGYRTLSLHELVGAGKNNRSVFEVPLQGLAQYSAEHADLTMKIALKQQNLLEETGLNRLCEEVEFPLVSVLARMEHAGIRLDTAYLNTMSENLESQIAVLISEIHNLAGRQFNINSTQQLAEILFKELGLRTVRKTKTGYSTDAGVLETLRHEHPIIEKLLEYRLLTKLKSTYVDALPLLADKSTQRVHTSFDQAVAATGRLASNDPNLQNIPIRTTMGRAIRKAFIPGSSSEVILSADYSQIELRIMAHICGDDGLINAFRNREDIHVTTASKVFGVEFDKVTPDMRRKAKEVNFGIMYGLSPFGLAQRLDINQAEARDIIANYFRRFPGVKQYIHDTIHSTRMNGYVTTLLGRRRFLPEINSRNGNIRSNAERQAINMPIQGTAADMIKKAMIAVDKAIVEERLGARMLLQVHDELVLEVPSGEIHQIRKLVGQLMESALPLSVPIEVEIGVGQNWLEAH